MNNKQIRQFPIFLLFFLYIHLLPTSLTLTMNPLFKQNPSNLVNRSKSSKLSAYTLQKSRYQPEDQTHHQNMNIQPFYRQVCFWAFIIVFAAAGIAIGLYFVTHHPHANNNQETSSSQNLKVSTIESVSTQTLQKDFTQSSERKILNLENSLRKEQDKALSEKSQQKSVTEAKVAQQNNENSYVQPSTQQYSEKNSINAQKRVTYPSKLQDSIQSVQQSKQNSQLQQKNPSTFPQKLTSDVQQVLTETKNQNSNVNEKKDESKQQFDNTIQEIVIKQSHKKASTKPPTK